MQRFPSHPQSRELSQRESLWIRATLGVWALPDATEKTNRSAVGEGLAPPEITVKLKPCGEVVREQLQLIETRFLGVTVEDYVIMPDHIHAVIFLHGKAGGASPSPTLDDVICAFKQALPNENV